MDTECGTVVETVIIEDTECNCQVFIPNSFTPNDDEINNEFAVMANCEVEDFNLKIFNRLGDAVFESHTIDQAWNGDASGTKERYTAGTRNVC